jgi:hypothetical protein
MALDELLICEWHGSDLRERRVPSPDWATVADSIRELDGAVRNDVYLQWSLADPTTYLCVGGGAGRYVLSGSVRGEQFFTVLNPAVTPTGVEPLVVGGQLGEYPNEIILDLAITLRMARAYFDSGRFDPTIGWVPQ